MGEKLDSKSEKNRVETLGFSGPFCYQASEEDNETRKKKLTAEALSVKTYFFVDSITMHGIRYIFGRDICTLRR